jgi:hypothetical protein
MLPDIAETVVTPGATAVTRPVASTVATAGSTTLHCTLGMVMTPFLPSTVAVRPWEVPVRRRRESGERTIESGVGATTSRVRSALEAVPLVAEIWVVPTVRATTFPKRMVATAGLELRQP